MRSCTFVRGFVVLVLLATALTASAINLPAALKGNLVVVPSTWKTEKDLQAAGWASEAEIQAALDALDFCCSDCALCTSERTYLTSPIAAYVVAFHDMYIVESADYRIFYPKTQDGVAQFSQRALLGRGERFGEMPSLQGNPPLLMLAHWKGFEPPSSYKDIMPANPGRYVIYIEVKDPVEADD